MPLLLICTVFLGAALIFVVEPLAAKMLLPRLGGGPAVWNTCMVFYQSVLLAGYAYAHWIGKLGWGGDALIGESDRAAWGGRSRRRAALIIHTVVVAAPMLVLQFGLVNGVGGTGGAAAGPVWTPPADAGVAGVAWWVIKALALMVGLPMLALSATAPLAQRWLAARGGAGSGNPYFLYAASNAGSLIGLLAFPFVLEPMLSMSALAKVWTVAYAVFVVVAIAAMLLASRPSARAIAPERKKSVPKAEVGAPLPGAAVFQPAVPITWQRRVLWLALSFAPSSLLLGVTNHIATDIAAVPLLWVVPLAVYLVTFIVAYSGRDGSGADVAQRIGRLALPLLALTIIITLRGRYSIWLLLAQHIGVLLAAGLALHGRLAALRPPPERLTGYYLIIALGGALGGVFNALVAPLVFTSIAEYPVALVMCVALAWSGGGFALRGGAKSATAPREPSQPAQASKRLVKASHARHAAQPAGEGNSAPVGSAPRRSLISRLLDLILPVAVLALIWFIMQRFTFQDPSSALARLATFGLGAALCAAFITRPVRFTLAFTALLALAWWQPMREVDGGGVLLHAERTFFGVHRVVSTHDGRVHTLMHGTTQHGIQAMDADKLSYPLSYYEPTGPLGSVFRVMQPEWDRRIGWIPPVRTKSYIPPPPGDRARVGIVGLGAGSIAAYIREQDLFTFVEIDPAVVRIATNINYFQYIRGGSNIVIGDGRLKLAATDTSTRGYDLIIIDAFASDAIPVHLITREAVRMYVSKLAPGGLIAFHTSNRHVDLVPVLDSIGRAEGLITLVGRDDKQPGAGGAAVGVGGAGVIDPRTWQGRTGSEWVVVGRSREDVKLLIEDTGAGLSRWQSLTKPTGVRAWTDDYSNVIGVLR